MVDLRKTGYLPKATEVYYTVGQAGENGESRVESEDRNTSKLAIIGYEVFVVDRQGLGRSGPLFHSFTSILDVRIARQTHGSRLVFYLEHLSS